MTTHDLSQDLDRPLTRHPVRSDLPDPAGTGHAPGASRPSTRWAWAGLAAGVASLGALVSAFMVDAVYDPDLDGDPEAIADKLGDQVPQIVAFHVLGTLAAVLLVVFAAGLHRRLRATAPADSVAPLVAFAGLLGTAVVMVLGTGLDTELVFAVGHDEFVTPDNQAFYNTWVGTIWWCWVLAGLSAIAVFVVSRTGGVPAGSASAAWSAAASPCCSASPRSSTSPA